MNSKTMRQAVICLAAGKSQVIVIQKAKELGLAVLAVDRNPNAPGFEFSDEQIILSTYEAPPIIERLHDLQRKYCILGVVNRSSGPPVITAAEICRAFDLPGVPPDSARIILDKSKMMAACAARGIAAPSCKSVSSLNDIDLYRLRFPCIVKPALSLVGKSGVSVVASADVLPDVFTIAHQTSLNGIVNIEEFLPGHDVSLMSLVQKGRLYPITLLDELNATDAEGNMYGVGFAVPSIFTGKPEESHILTLARKIINSFEIDTNPFMMSCRCEPSGRPKLIELHLDIGGDLVLDALLSASSSFDVLGYIIQMLSGKQQPSYNPVFHPAAILYEQGKGLVSNHPYQIITAPDRIGLEYHLSTWQEKIK